MLYRFSKCTLLIRYGTELGELGVRETCIEIRNCLAHGLGYKLVDFLSNCSQLLD